VAWWGSDVGAGVQIDEVRRYTFAKALGDLGSRQRTIVQTDDRQQVTLAVDAAIFRAASTSSPLLTRRRPSNRPG
jgi:hypothetical protein